LTAILPSWYNDQVGHGVFRNGWRAAIKTSSQCLKPFFDKQIKGYRVNKQELIENIAASADITKAAAGRALDSMIDSVTDALKKGESVVLVGFGTFTVRQRAARMGRNPQTGAEIQISAAKVPAFKAGKALKDAVN
jgi:DNA-binding protein HU-beta